MSRYTCSTVGLVGLRQPRLLSPTGSRLPGRLLGLISISPHRFFVVLHGVFIVVVFVFLFRCFHCLFSLFAFLVFFFDIVFLVSRAFTLLSQRSQVTTIARFPPQNFPENHVSFSSRASQPSLLIIFPFSLQLQVLISCGPMDGCHGGDAGVANKWMAEHGITVS